MKTGRKFVGECISKSVGRNVWRIVKGFSFGPVDVEDGFLTDFASVPRIFWVAIPSTDYYWDAPSAGHDKAVRCRKLLGLSLMECHALFLEMLMVRGQLDPLPADANIGKRIAHYLEQKKNNARARAMYGAVVACNWMFAGDGMGGTPASLLKRVQVVDLREAD